MYQPYCSVGFLISSAVNAESGGPSKGHRDVTAVVTAEKSGLLTVKLPDGTTMTLNSKNAERHGHEAPKVGDEVTLVLTRIMRLLKLTQKAMRVPISS